jgi:carbon-monoxide dehydrogenase small subunit
MDERNIQFTINGRQIQLTVPVQRTLLELIRNDVGLTGTKEGCDQGECGACTVLLNGVPIHSCCTLAVEADGCRVLTVEGLRTGEELHPLQKAFIEVGAVQCGFCTPGMLLSAKALLDENDNPTEAEVRKAIEGNICRCTGYDRIIRGILKGAEYLRVAAQPAAASA